MPEKIQYCHGVVARKHRVFDPTYIPRIAEVVPRSKSHEGMTQQEILDQAKQLAEELNQTAGYGPGEGPYEGKLLGKRHFFFDRRGSLRTHGRTDGAIHDSEDF